MNESVSRTKLAILVNIIAPYRVPIYRRLGEVFDVTLYVSGKESNRGIWSGVEARLDNVDIQQSRGVTLAYRKGDRSNTFDYRYLHVTPGYIFQLLRDRPDQVISIEMGFRTLTALLYGTLFRKPVWIWWGGTKHTERSIGVFRRTARLLISRWAKRWISYGVTSTEYLLSLGVPEERILQIQNCMEETLYEAVIRPAVVIEPRPVLLYVGQLIGRKGVGFLLEAASVLHNEGYSFSILLVGEGPEKKVLENQAMRLGLNNVHFYPPQPPELMPSVYHSADYLVFPTLEDVWGLVVNEALWSGLPVLSSVYGGCTQEIIPRSNRFDPLNMEDFVRVLRLAVEGRVGSVDLSLLKRYGDVANMIIDEIEAA